MRAWNVELAICDDLVIVNATRKATKIIDEGYFVSLEEAFNAIKDALDDAREWY